MCARPAKARQRSGFDARRLLPLSLVAVGAAVYANSLDGAFLFDDTKQILENPRIRQLWPLANTLSGRRPVVDFSLAVNYAIGEYEVTGYHVVNVAVHILAALTLFGIVRRTLLRPRLRDRCAKAAPWLALATALIWLVHPLQTQSVTYLIQRSESMMGLFYLLTLYCVIRGVDSPRSTWWYTAGVACCALAMGSKAVAVTAPVAVALYDRVFVSTSFKELLVRRWPLYLGFVATWGVLLICGVAQGVLFAPSRAATVGFGYQGVTPWQYAATQPGVILHYLRLSLWPAPLCLDYGWPVARSASQFAAPAIVVCGLLATTVWALVRKPPLGFAMAWFFLILLPTSSFIPIKDRIFEHRMYLPLASVVLLGVLAAWKLITVVAERQALSRRTRAATAAALLIAATAPLAYGTVTRNQDYRSEFAMWKDVVQKRPKNPRGHDGLGALLFRQGNIDAAIEEFKTALRLDPSDGRVYRNLGTALSEYGDVHGAIRAYRETLRRLPRDPSSHLDLGDALFSAGEYAAAEERYRKALELNPRLDRAHHNLGVCLIRQGRPVEGIASIREAIRINPDSVAAHFGLGAALFNMGRFEEAVASFRQVLRLDPDHAAAREALAKAMEKSRP